MRSSRTDRPAHALQHRSRRWPRSTPRTSVKVCPRGPYLLGGHCNGALEALEIARQFRAENESVPGIVMIQPPSVDRRRRLIDGPVRIGARLASLTEEQRVDMYLRVREVMERIRDRPSESPGIVYRSVRRLLAGSAAGRTRPDEEPRQQPRTRRGRHDDAVWDRMREQSPPTCPEGLRRVSGRVHCQRGRRTPKRTPSPAGAASGRASSFTTFRAAICPASRRTSRRPAPPSMPT